MSITLRVALVGGPMYDALYAERLPAFTAATGISIDVVAQPPHAALNVYLAGALAKGDALDLISSHTKYAPSQSFALEPLDEFFETDELAQFSSPMIELSRVDGQLMGIPRNIDTRLLHYRADLFADQTEQEAFFARFGRSLVPPETWAELHEVASFFSRPPHLYGYAMPGRGSGLWGGFYELIEGGGGHFFQPDLSAAFDSPAGRHALSYVRELWASGCLPPESLDWEFDAVSAAFKAGRVAMIGDWPASYSSHVAVLGDRLGLALYPAGPVARKVYSGGFTFAIPRNRRDRDASLALLRWLSNADSQRFEAAQGTLVTRTAVMTAFARTLPPGSSDRRRQSLLAETVAAAMLIPPRFSAYHEVEGVVWPYLQRAMAGEQSIESALALAATEMNVVLARFR